MEMDTDADLIILDPDQGWLYSTHVNVSSGWDLRTHRSSSKGQDVKKTTQPTRIYEIEDILWWFKSELTILVIFHSLCLDIE